MTTPKITYAHLLTEPNPKHVESLIKFFESGCQQRGTGGFGVEIEHLPVHNSDDTAVTYYESNGIEALFNRIRPYYDENKEYWENGRLVGLARDGISGVCKWAQLPDEVEFVLSVLERLSKRYGHRRALMGIEIINEPNTTTCWPMANVTERYKAVDPELAEGTGPIAFDWLKDFYITAYHRLRDADKGALPADKAVVFHDGFDIEQWKDFMRGDDGRLAPEFENVDTHQYLMTAEMMGCPQTVEGYDDFVRNTYAPMIAEMSEYFPVIVGEWCLFNSVGCGVDTHGGQSVLNGEEGAQAETLTAEQKRSLYQGVAESQLAAWSKGSGFYYWNYKLLTDTMVGVAVTDAALHEKTADFDFFDYEADETKPVD